MKSGLGDGFLKMLKSNMNIDDRTMNLIARASIAKKPMHKHKSQTYEEDMLANIDEAEKLDEDDKSLE